MKPEFKIDTLVMDMKRDRLGYVKGHEGPYVQLRPPGGGVEWDASPARVRPATDAEHLRALREQDRVRAGRRSA